MIAIFDIDGVLADDSLTAKLNPINKTDMEKFEKLVPALKPVDNMVRVARALSLAKIPIYIFTARSERVRGATEDWLYEQGIDFKRVFMREKGNTHTPVALKIKMFYELLYWGKNFDGGVVLFEDNPAVCAAFRRNSDINMRCSASREPTFVRTGGLTVCEVQ